jgi:hypothetical protein
MFKKKYPRDEIDTIPPYIYKPTEYFTNTSDYSYFYEFTQGMELIADFESSDLCITSLTDFLDDFTQY